MVDKELAKALLKAVPGAEKVVRADGCIFVFCKKSDVNINPYLRGVDIGDYSVCAIKARTSFADEVLARGEVVE